MTALDTKNRAKQAPKTTGKKTPAKTGKTPDRARSTKKNGTKKTAAARKQPAATRKTARRRGRPTNEQYIRMLTDQQQQLSVLAQLDRELKPHITALRKTIDQAIRAFHRGNGNQARMQERIDKAKRAIAQASTDKTRARARERLAAAKEQLAAAKDEIREAAKNLAWINRQVDDFFKQQGKAFGRYVRELEKLARKAMKPAPRKPGRKTRKA